MKLTIHVPDYVGDRLRNFAASSAEHGEEELNVSAICQGAIERELLRRGQLRVLRSDLHRVEGNAPETHGGKFAFTGKELVHRDKSVGGNALTAYLTKRGKIAVYHHDEGLYVFADVEDMELNGWDAEGGDLLVEIAKKLGEDHVAELEF